MVYIYDYYWCIDYTSTLYVESTGNNLPDFRTRLSIIAIELQRVLCLLYRDIKPFRELFCELATNKHVTASSRISEP